MHTTLDGTGMSEKSEAEAEVVVLRRLQDRVLTRIQETHQERAVLRQRMDELMERENLEMTQLRGLALTIAELTGEPVQLPISEDADDDGRRATARERAMLMARRHAEEAELRAARAEKVRARDDYKADEARRRASKRPGPNVRAQDDSQSNDRGRDEHRAAVMRRLHWSRMARTDAIAALLEQTGRPMSPAEMSEVLMSRGRKEDTARLVSASLSHLRRQGRVESAGHGVWVHAGSAESALFQEDEWTFVDAVPNEDASDDQSDLTADADEGGDTEAS
jgi:hypothetical protein